MEQSIGAKTVGQLGHSFNGVISDVTETEVLKQKRHDAAVVFACITACVCLYLLLLATLDFLVINVPVKMLTQVINAMVFAFSIVIYKKTEFSREELGFLA